MPPNREKQVVIVGAGISGLTLAYLLAEHPAQPQVTVLEAGPRASENESRGRRQRQK